MFFHPVPKSAQSLKSALQTFGASTIPTHEAHFFQAVGPDLQFE
jgi:hypothetical protein